MEQQEQLLLIEYADDAIKDLILFNEFDEGIRIMLIEINEHYGDK